MPHRVKPSIATLSVLPVLAVLAACPATAVAQDARTDLDRLFETLPSEPPGQGADADRPDDQRRTGRAQANGARDEAGGLRGTLGADDTPEKATISSLDAPPFVVSAANDEPLEPLAVAEDAVLETPEEDPYAPIGMRLGSFLLFPELAVESVYHDNVFLSPTRPEGDWSLALTPGLAARSDWNRHSLEARVGGERSFHERFSTENEETFATTVEGRLDVRRDTSIVASAGYARGLEDRGSSDFPANAASRALVKSDEWSLEGNHTFNRLTVTLRGDVSGETFGNSLAADGTTIDNSQRDYTENRVTTRLAYEFQPGVQAFVEGSTNERDFDRRIDDNGLLSGSSGHDVQAGLAFKLTGKLTGEASAGYALQTPDDRTLEDVSGLIFNAALDYKATDLTTLRFKAASGIAETTQAGSAGSIDRSVGFSVEHRPRRNIMLGASFAYENEEFSGSGDTTQDWVTGLMGEYLFTPSVGLVVRYDHVKSVSSAPGSDYTTNEVRMGLKFRR